jgi:regulator of cell morphogenesis and NO signaling
MVQEHEKGKVLLAELRRVANDFRPPVWACSTFIALYEGLRTFAGRLEEHIRLENEVLFPRAIQMEEKLMHGGAR